VCKTQNLGGLGVRTPTVREAFACAKGRDAPPRTPLFPSERLRQRKVRSVGIELDILWFSQDRLIGVYYPHSALRFTTSTNWFEFGIAGRVAHHGLGDDFLGVTPDGIF
jgi:hypothetical protein